MTAFLVLLFWLALIGAVAAIYHFGVEIYVRFEAFTFHMPQMMRDLIYFG